MTFVSFLSEERRLSKVSVYRDSFRGCSAGKCFQLRSCSSCPRMCSASAFSSHIFLTFISTLIHHILCWDKLLHVMLQNQCSAAQNDPQPLSHSSFSLCSPLDWHRLQIACRCNGESERLCLSVGALINCLRCAPAGRKSAGISSSACGPLKDKQV